MIKASDRDSVTPSLLQKGMETLACLASCGPCKHLCPAQDGEQKQREKAERLRFGRFFYRFPHGESGADVYDRMTIFEDHMIRSGIPAHLA